MRVAAVDPHGLRLLAVYLPVDDRSPPVRQELRRLVRHRRIAQRDRCRHNQRLVRSLLPQAVDDNRHVLQHAARPLEVLQRGPVLVEADEHLGMDRIALTHLVDPSALLHHRRKRIPLLVVV